jgi:hypothetical protein
MRFEKVHAIDSLYLAPPDRVFMPCIDEKSQVQALDRTQPLLRLRPGQAERPTHDCAVTWQRHVERADDEIPRRHRGATGRRDRATSLVSCPGLRRGSVRPHASGATLSQGAYLNRLSFTIFRKYVAVDYRMNFVSQTSLGA